MELLVSLVQPIQQASLVQLVLIVVPVYSNIIIPILVITKHPIIVIIILTMVVRW